MFSSRSQSSRNPRILISFLCVYLFWGSTYLAMRYGLEVLPPFVMASTRFLISGSVLLAICAIGGVRMLPSMREFGTLAIIGVLMLGCGNTAVLWSELYLVHWPGIAARGRHSPLRCADRSVSAQRRRPARARLDRRCHRLHRPRLPGLAKSPPQPPRRLAADHRHRRDSCRIVLLDGWFRHLAALDDPYQRVRRSRMADVLRRALQHRHHVCRRRISRLALGPGGMVARYSTS